MIFYIKNAKLKKSLNCYPPFIKSYSCYVEHSDFHHFTDDVGHRGHSGGLAHRLHPEGQPD